MYTEWTVKHKLPHSGVEKSTRCSKLYIKGNSFYFPLLKGGRGTIERAGSTVFILYARPLLPFPKSQRIWLFLRVSGNSKFGQSLKLHKTLKKSECILPCFCTVQHIFRDQGWYPQNFWSFKPCLNLEPVQLGVFKTGFAEVISYQTLSTISIIQTWRVLRSSKLSRKLQAWWVSGYRL